ncbi:MAG: hypothetical protein J1F03_01095 [Oscillospiraceae bacterium]|nr:hypothetical protein [Oscillospiraceae bacterium]
MDKILFFVLPLFAVALVMSPIFVALYRKSKGKSVNAKRAVITNIASFFGILLMTTFLPFTSAFAETVDAAANAAGVLTDSGIKYLAAALSTGVGSIAAGIAVGSAAPAAIGAISENEKVFSKALIFVALGEGVAIYGLLISILILFG